METNTYAALVGFVDMLLDAICVVDVEGRYVYVSAASERIFGYRPDELVGRSMIDLVHPDDRERTLQEARHVIAGQPRVGFENRYIRKDGQVVHIMWSARWSQVDRLRIAVARDVTERKQAERLQAALFGISEAAHTAEDLLALFKHIHGIIGDLLPAQNFSFALYDRTCDRMTFPYHIDSHDPQRLHPALDAIAGEIARSGKPLLLCANTLASGPESLRHLVIGESLCWMGVPLSTPNGTIGALMVKSQAGMAHYREKDQELLQFVSTQVASAVERKQMQERLQQLAQYDQLTLLPNRALLYERLESALEKARTSQGRLSVLYLDLDKFKVVNDTLGHAAGDILLQEVARRLQACVRKTDTVARIGGDEFVVLLDAIGLPQHALQVAAKIRDALNKPMVLKGNDWEILPSIGIAHYPDHADDLDQLFKHADEAMYNAKKSGGNRFQA